MHKTKKQLLSTLLGLFMVGCGEGSGTVENSPKDNNLVTVNTEFAATYLQSLGSDLFQSALKYSQAAMGNMVKLGDHDSLDRQYHGRLKVTNTLTGEEQRFDWVVTQQADGKVVSQQTLPIEPGCYDMDLVLTLDGNDQQFVANIAGKEVSEDSLSELDFVLYPSLGETKINIDDVRSLPVIKIAFSLEELSALAEPQLGLSVNGEPEQVFTLNHATEAAQFRLNLEPGYHRLQLHLYDADMMVGKADRRVRFARDKCTKVAIGGVNAKANVTLTELKDQGTFTFTIPDEVVDEVGSAQDLALIVRLARENMPVQERVLTVRYDGGLYKARELFETQGVDKADAYLAFHKVSEASDGFNLTPFASCNMTIHLGDSHKSECRLKLKREQVRTKQGLGALVLNVLDNEQQPVSGVKVFIDGELAGMTGNVYSTGSIKTYLVPGEHEIQVVAAGKLVTESIMLKPKAEQSKTLYM